MDFNSLRTKNGSAAETILIVDDDVINRGILENIFLPFYYDRRSGKREGRTGKNFGGTGSSLRHSVGCCYAGNGWNRSPETSAGAGSSE